MDAHSRVRYMLHKCNRVFVSLRSLQNRCPPDIVQRREHVVSNMLFYLMVNSAVKMCEALCFENQCMTTGRVSLWEICVSDVDSSTGVNLVSFDSGAILNIGVPSPARKAFTYS